MQYEPHFRYPINSVDSICLESIQPKWIPIFWILKNNLFSKRCIPDSYAYSRTKFASTLINLLTHTHARAGVHCLVRIHKYAFLFVSWMSKFIKIQIIVVVNLANRFRTGYWITSWRCLSHTLCSSKIFIGCYPTLSAEMDL